MILDFVRIERFKNLRDFENKFKPGLSIIRAPNEEGKSSLMTGLHLAIFGDATTSKKEVLSQKSWTAERLFKIQLGFHENENTYVITRDFENKRNTLTLPDGTSLKDKRSIQRTILGVLGFPSESSYRCSASITQDEISVMESGAKELRTLLEERIVGAGPVDLNEILKGLDKYNKSLRRGGREPGLLSRLTMSAAGLAEERGELEKQVSRLQSIFIELKNTVEELDQLEKDFATKEKMLEKSKKYLEQKRRYREGEVRFKGAKDKTEKRAKATEENRRLPKRIAELREELAKNETLLKHSKSYHEMEREYERTEDERGKLEKRIRNIGSVTSELNELKRKGEILQSITQEDYKSALDIPQQIENVQKGLEAQEMLLSVVPKNRLSLDITTDHNPTEPHALESTFSTSARHRIHLDIEGVAEIEVQNQGEGVQGLIKEIERKKEVRQSILDKYEAKNNDELTELMEEQTARSGRETELSTQLKILLADEEIEDLQSRLAELSGRAKEISGEKEELKEHALSESQIEERASKLQALKQEIEELDAQYNRNVGTLQGLEEEQELGQELAAATKELAVSEHNLQELQQYECSMEESLKIEDDIGSLRGRIGTLRTNKAVLEDRVSNARAGSDLVAELTEKAQSCENQINRCKRRIEVNEIISDNLQEARKLTIEGVSSLLGERTSVYLSEMTGGKYEQVRLEDNFKICVYSAEKRDWVEPVSRPDEVSGGLLDQLYFAARLALVEIIARDHAPPLFMDDPFIHFDSSRRDKAIGLLRKFADKFQVLVFTCHDYPLPASIKPLQLHSCD